MDGFRSTSLGLAVALILAGPLAPVAWAQQPMLYEEAVKAKPPAEPGPAHEMGAVVVNVVHVPGKAILCTLGGVVGFVTLIATAGSSYRTAARLMNEGCGGPWAITAKDFQAALEEDPGRKY